LTEISFHFNVADKVAYACRLLRKAVNGGAKILVAGEPQSLSQLDAALWTFSPVDFVPHCFQDSDASQLAASPVLLASSAGSSFGSAPDAPAAQVLLNLGGGIPDGFERFERLIEVVGVDDQDRELSRLRWKQYARRGYAITRHDLASVATN
jgi:DNA polymerase III subunit chi